MWTQAPSIRYGFRAGAKVILYSVNEAQVPVHWSTSHFTCTEFTANEENLLFLLMRYVWNATFELRFSYGLPYYLFISSFFRAHLNDLENIPIFLIIALMFMLANLSPIRGIWCLRIFTAARILHTIVYLNAILIPRVLCFVTGSVCIVVLGISVLLSVAPAGVS